jgi:hypothetical protein
VCRFTDRVHVDRAAAFQRDGVDHQHGGHVGQEAGCRHSEQSDEYKEAQGFAAAASDDIKLNKSNAQSATGAQLQWSLAKDHNATR